MRDILSVEAVLEKVMRPCSTQRSLDLNGRILCQISLCGLKESDHLTAWSTIEMIEFGVQ